MNINNNENMTRTKYSLNELDFEKINATLANPEFANWYYNKIHSKSNNTTIDDFVKIIKDYSEQNSSN